MYLSMSVLVQCHSRQAQFFINSQILLDMSPTGNKWDEEPPTYTS